jgi:transposase
MLRVTSELGKEADDVYVGIDVHRKRSQVAVIDQDGEVLADGNVPNEIEAI